MSELRITRTDLQENLNFVENQALTIPEAAAYLGKSEAHIRELIQQSPSYTLQFKDTTLVLRIFLYNRRLEEGENPPMPFLKNQYQGVNPHMMSRFQQAWSNYHAFHNSYVVHLADMLNDHVPAGYLARNEDNFLIERQLKDDTEQKLPDQVRYPDVTIRTAPPVPPRIVASSTEAVAPDLQVPLAQMTDDLEKQSVIIYRLKEDDNIKNRISVAAIELLSPTNKTAARRDYQKKRLEFFATDIVLVEVDFLHEFPSPIPGLPRYPKDDESTPYYLALSDPRPENPKTVFFRFGLQQKIPTITIPLLGKDTVTVDFDAVFQYTFERGRYGYDIDYNLEPPHLDSYSPSDRALIRQHMQHIQK